VRFIAREMTETRVFAFECLDKAILQLRDEGGVSAGDQQVVVIEAT
jgi:hypothetical protein